MNNLLSYSFNVSIAKKYGLNEAIMIHNFVFWLSKNKANNKHYHDEHYWTYNTKKAFTELFPFWTYEQIKRILKSLIKQKVLITGNYSKVAYDRTLWYAFNNEDEFLMDSKPALPTISANATMDSCKSTNLYHIKNTDRKQHVKKKFSSRDNYSYPER